VTAGTSVGAGVALAFASISVSMDMLVFPSDGCQNLPLALGEPGVTPQRPGKTGQLWRG
jgi:hypothetical protein